MKFLPAIFASIIFGLLWASGLSYIGSYRINYEGIPGGAIAGLFAGIYTIWSMNRNNGKESIANCLITLIIGVSIFSLIFMCMYDIGRADHYYDMGLSGKIYVNFLLMIYVNFLCVLWSPLLLPLTYCTRQLVWFIYRVRK